MRQAPRKPPWAHGQAKGIPVSHPDPDHIDDKDPRYASGAMFGRLWRGYLRPHRWLMLFAFLVMTVEGSTLGLLSYSLKPLFDKVLKAARAAEVPHVVYLTALPTTVPDTEAAMADWHQAVSRHVNQTGGLQAAPAIGALANAWDAWKRLWIALDL